MLKEDRAELLVALREVVGGQFDTWVSQPCAGLGNETPEQLIEMGKVGCLWKMIHEFQQSEAAHNLTRGVRTGYVTFG